jgi:hypothetical protein
MTEKKFLDNTFKYEDDKLWRMDKRSKKWQNFDDIKPTVYGYVHIGLTINGKPKKYLLHRLVYFFHNQEWNINDTCQDNSIDHRNGDKLDNKIENLKNVTSSQNNQNITHMNKKEITGVLFRKDCRTKPWQAQWYENKKNISKYFATEEEALAHRKKMMETFYYCPRKLS